jgi:hypothetical protein
MHQWLDALALWWGITWRYYLTLLILVVTLMVAFEVILKQSSEAIGPYYDQFSFHLKGGEGPALKMPIFFLLVFDGMIWLVGWSGKNLINNPYGGRRVESTISSSQSDASWKDGLILQWALSWRVFPLYFLVAMVMFFRNWQIRNYSCRCCY